MTFPLDRIVAATDLSERGFAAVSRAVRLSGETGASLSVIHVVDDEIPDELAALILDRAGGLVDAQVQRARAALGAAAGPTDVTVEVPRGRPHSVLAERMQAADTSLLVIGRHRHDSVVDIFGVSTAERVLRLTAKPVLVARRAAQRPYREALVAIDFGPASEQAAVAARQIAATARRTLLTVVDVAFAGFLGGPGQSARHGETRGDLAALARRLDERAEVALAEGPVTETLLDEAGRRVADLVAIGTNGTRMRSLIFGSVAKEVIERSDCDTLVVRDRAAPPS